MITYFEPPRSLSPAYPQHTLVDTLISLIRKAAQVQQHAQRRSGSVSARAKAVATRVNVLREKLQPGAYPWGVEDSRVRNEFSHVDDFLDHPQTHAEDVACVRGSLEQLMHCYVRPKTGVHDALDTLSHAQFQSTYGAPPRPAGPRKTPSDRARTLAEKLASMETMVDQVVRSNDTIQMDAVSQAVSVMNDMKQRCHDNTQHVEDFFHLQDALDHLTAKLQPLVDKRVDYSKMKLGAQARVGTRMGYSNLPVGEQDARTRFELAERNTTMWTQRDEVSMDRSPEDINLRRTAYELRERLHNMTDEYNTLESEHKRAEASSEETLASLEAECAAAEASRKDASEQVMALEGKLGIASEQENVFEAHLKIARQHAVTEQQQAQAAEARLQQIEMSEEASRAQVDSVMAELAQAMLQQQESQELEQWNLEAQVDRTAEEHQQVQYLEEELRGILKSNETSKMAASARLDQVESRAQDVEKQLQESEFRLASTSASLAQVTAEYNAMVESSFAQRESWMQKIVSQQQSLMDRHHEQEEMWTQKALSREQVLIESQREKSEFWAQQCEKTRTDSRAGEEAWTQKALSQEATLMEKNVENGALTEEIIQLRGMLARTEAVLQQKDRYMNDMQREVRKCDEKWVKRSLQVEKLHDKDISQMWHENAELREENFQLMHRFKTSTAPVDARAPFIPPRAIGPPMSEHLPHCALAKAQSPYCALALPQPRGMSPRNALCAPALTPRNA